jgi:UDP-2,3-diacylglucosamine hydrolase
MSASGDAGLPAAGPEPLLFASDVHLEPEDGGKAALFEGFLEHAARRGGALYLLGDLFDFWVGPKQLRLPGHGPVLDALARTSARIPVTLVPGNRDFHLDAAFTARCGVRVAGDPHPVRIGDRRALLTHGDLLCARDRSYRRSRAILRSAPFRWLIRAAPFRLTYFLAGGYRSHSARAVRQRPVEARDLCYEQVWETFREGWDVILCGHVHRGRKLEVSVDGRARELYTLGDWSASGSYVEYREGAFRLLPFPGDPARRGWDP